MNPEAVKIVILVFPETSSSVVYGLYDLFLSAGRDWGVIVNGEPGPKLIQPLLVSPTGAAVEVPNGVRIAVAASLAQCPPVTIACVPEVNLPPGAVLNSRFAEETSWLRQRHAEGTALAAACSGAMLFAGAGYSTATSPRLTGPGVTRCVRVSRSPGTCPARAGGDRRRSTPDHGERRLVLAGPRALSTQ